MHLSFVIFVLLVSSCDSVEEGKTKSTDGFQLVDAERFNNKYREKEPVRLEEIIFGQDATSFAASSKCHLDLDIIWRADLGTEIFNTPIITDIDSDGQKDIIFATSMHYIEALNNKGFKVMGWPFAFADSRFLASPLLFDIDGDGKNEVVVTTEDAHVVFLGATGLPLYGETLRVPPLRVQKDWYEGLDLPNLEASMSLSGQQDEAKNAQPQSRKLLELNREDKISSGSTSANIFQGFQGWLTDEGIESLELFLPSSTPSGYVASVREQKDPLHSKQYQKYLNMNNTEPSSKDVFVDPHVLHTPIIADLDADGMYELIVPVSYYFDRAKYAEIEELAKLPLDLDISKYVAAAVVVFDLSKKDIKFIANLDLTTDSSLYSGYLYSSPTVIDINNDGKLEIIVGTGVGFIHMIDHQGKSSRKTFPLMMDSLFAQVIVEDVNNDGELEIIGCDTNSNVVCFNAQGQELWENRISGYPNQAPSIGDINGDGILDIVIGTTEGHVWALRGDNGESLPNFPVKLKGRVQSQPLLIRLDPYKVGMHIVVNAFDGHIYIIDGMTSCFEKLDLGETSYSMVLADDITGNGKMDLIVTTRNGNVYILGTEMPYYPLSSWTSQLQGRNGFTSREHQGIYILEGSRGYRDVDGASFIVQFEIVDKRPVHKRPPSYEVTISWGSEKIFEKTYYASGVYSEIVPSLHQRLRATLQVEMINEFQQAYSDSFSLSFNVHFGRLLKWVLVVPFTLMSMVLIFFKEIQTPLPLSLD